MRKKAGIRRWKTKSHTHRVRGDINARCNDWHSFSASFSTSFAESRQRKKQLSRDGLRLARRSSSNYFTRDLVFI